MARVSADGTSGWGFPVTRVDLVRWQCVVGGRPQERDCLAVLLTLGAADGPGLELDSFGWLHALDPAAPDGRRLAGVLPIEQALRQGPRSTPYPTSAPEGSWQSKGLGLLPGEPGPPPMIFDVTDIPEGDYELELHPSLRLPIRILHPPSVTRRTDEEHGWAVDGDTRFT